MTEAVVGSVSVDVVPSAETFWSDFKAKTTPGAAKAGSDLGDALGPPIASSVRDAVSKGLSESGPAVKEQGSEQGAAYGDAFDKQVVSRLEAALKNLPDAEINADTKPAEAKLAELRATLAGFTDADYLSLNVDDETTLANLATLQAELDELTGPEHDIRVRVNAGAASAELAGLQAQLDKLSRSSADGTGSPDLGGIGKGASAAGGGIYQYLIPALGALATVAGPLLAVGGGLFGTALLGAQGLKTEVETGLTPAFHALQDEAAGALGPGVTAALTQLEQALPKLDPLIDEFGSALGNEVDKFATFLNNGGLTGFVQYAERELPLVESAFDNAAAAAANLFNAATPSGNALISSLSGVLTVLGQAAALQAAVNAAGGTPKGSSFGALSKNAGANALLTVTGPSTEAINAYSQLSTTQVAGHGTQAPSAVAAQQQQQAAALQAAAALGTTVDAYNTASAAAQQLSSQTAASTLQMQLENNAAGLLSQALQGLGGDSLGVAQANTQFQTGLLTLGSTLSKNQDAVEGNSASALANQAAIQQQVAAAQAIYDATTKQTGSTKEGKAAYDAAITSIEAATGATGKNKGSIDAYIDSIDAIPALKETDLDLETDAAEAALAKFQHDLASVGLTQAQLSPSDLLNTASVNLPGHAAGGMVADGWFTAGEQGTELGYKSGSSVSFMNHADTMAVTQMPAVSASNQPPTTIIVQSILDGKVVATSVNEYNLAAGRR